MKYFVLLYGNANTPLDKLSGLWLAHANWRKGKLTYGWVVNGAYDFYCDDTHIYAGENKKNPINRPEQWHEVTFDFKDANYNEVIEEARRILIERESK